jgi:PAS domain S-box-containing protein
MSKGRIPPGSPHIPDPSAKLELTAESAPAVSRASGQCRDSPPPALQEAGPGIAIVDAVSGKFEAVNARFSRALGYQPEELMGQPLLGCYPENERARVGSAMRIADKSGTATLETYQQHRDGREVPLQVTFLPLKDAQGRVTQRILMAGAGAHQFSVAGSQFSHERPESDLFHRLADEAPVGLLLMDARGACAFANRAWSEITAVNAEQAHRNGWREVICTEDRDRVSAAWQAMLQGTPLQMKFRYCRPGGEFRWVQAQGIHLTDDGDTFLGYALVNVDVTEDLKERSDLDRAYARIRSLAHRLERLREDERFDVANRLHGTLRQEMTALKSEINTLLHRMRSIEGAAGAFGFVSKLIEKCLQQLRHITFDLHPPGVEDMGLVGAMKRFAEECAVQTGLRIELDASDKLPALDRYRSLALYRTFQEALNNVVRHARAGFVAVQLWIQDDTVRLRISDDGVGIGDKDRAKTECYGLLLSSERLAQVGGTLRILGVSGKGTTLDASLPVTPEIRTLS